MLENGDLDEVNDDLQKQNKPQKQENKSKIVMQSVVKRVTNLFRSTPCLNLILQSQPYPRLWIESTMESDQKEGDYKKDILLYGDLKVKLKNAQTFEIICPYSKKTYTFNTAQAKQWHMEIN